jgi:hypothetical protein
VADAGGRKGRPYGTECGKKSDAKNQKATTDKKETLPQRGERASEGDFS